MGDWLKGGAVVAAFLAGVILTHKYESQKLENAELQAAILRANDGRKSYERILEAQNELDALRSERDGLRTSVERLRRAESQRAKRESASACGMEREAVAKCERLLKEGADLLAEGGNLLQRNAGIHDALARATETK